METRLKCFLLLLMGKEVLPEELVDRYFELALRKGNREAFVDRFKLKSSRGNLIEYLILEVLLS